MMSVLASLNGWLAKPVHQLIVPAVAVSDRGSTVHLRLCDGHAVVVPQNLLRPSTPAEEPREVQKKSVTLRLSDLVAPDEADFLYRLVSVALRLATFVRAGSPGPRPTQHRDPVSDRAVQFVLHPSDFKPSKGEGKQHLVSFRGLWTIAVPTSLLDVEQITTARAGELLGYRVSFKPTSQLASVLNQLVRLITELIGEVQLSANVPA